jgi:hypothetical protein
MPREAGPRSEQRLTNNTRWLDDREEAAWRAFALAMDKLRDALEFQLERDADLSFIEYHSLPDCPRSPTTACG